MMPRLNDIIAMLKQIEEAPDSGYQVVFGNRQRLAKDTFLLREHQVATKFYFLEEGIARQYFHGDGKEISNDFFFPCEFVDSYGTSSLGLPSKVNIQLVTDACVRVIDYGLLREAERKHPVVWQVEQLIAASNILWLEERLHAIQHSSATERYLTLIKKHPHLIKEIPLSYIASYLGISLETLSRIRAKLRI